MSSREPGTIFDGKYEIVQPLASGGMGEVYLVRHVHLQELRVVKILRQDLAADPVAQKRFVREARLATQIKHPNVAILYDFSRLPDGSFYMVWEHIQGRDVGDWVRERGPFPVGTAIRLGIQALRGLGAIHSAGIIHRDVSPDNLMIMENNRQQAWLKIIDLGLAKNLAPEDSTSSGSFEITQVGMFMGKLQYCSPEQAGTANGEILDRRSDLYSFALVLYEMVTGLPPFESESPHGFIFKRLSEDPLPMIGRNPAVEVPFELDRVVRQALERDRERRYPDSVSFIMALERVEKALSKIETQEVTMPPGARAAARPDTPPRQRSSSELSRAERIDLLAQIERAAKRVSESSLDLARAEGSIAAGNLDEARRLVAQIEAANPRTAGLDRIKERLAAAGTGAVAAGSGPAPSAARPAAPAPPPMTAAAPPAAATAGPVAATAPSMPPAKTAAGPAVAPAPSVPPPAAPPVPAPAAPFPSTPAPAAPPADATTADQRQRTAEAEKALRRYLERKQLPLARLALETLLELAPQHPNRADYESWVTLLADEVEQDRRAEIALAAARAAIVRRDFAKARQELDLVRRNDLSGERAAALERELDEVEQGLRQGADFERHKQRLDELLAARKLAEAEREIEQLAGLGLSNFTLDSYRERLREARLATDQERQAAPIEKRYREVLQARDWFAAREAAAELESIAPASPRPAAMYAEVERLESIHKHQQAAEQGVLQVDAFLEKGDLRNAELALRILLSIDPENRHRKRLERQLRAGR
ncbi:MAG TPA: serine/threonine-protein kinase [Thermoanaerobaculia bacterium]|nr:serine/threonine-protein kinase [Thermoanaerobaculia bacterium]